MIYLLLMLVSNINFVPIDGFSELDALANPTDFGLLLIMSDDSLANKAMATNIVEAVDLINDENTADIFLYCVSMNASGYYEIASLAGQFGGFPSVVVIVGHCGFLELDPEFIEAEIEDAWYQWGSGSTQGICNYCKRCNPN